MIFKDGFSQTGPLASNAASMAGVRWRVMFWTFKLEVLQLYLLVPLAERPIWRVKGQRYSAPLQSRVYQACSKICPTNPPDRGSGVERVQRMQSVLDPDGSPEQVCPCFGRF